MDGEGMIAYVCSLEDGISDMETSIVLLNSLVEEHCNVLPCPENVAEEMTRLSEKLKSDFRRIVEDTNALLMRANTIVALNSQSIKNRAIMKLCTYLQKHQYLMTELVSTFHTLVLQLTWTNVESSSSSEEQLLNHLRQSIENITDLQRKVITTFNSLSSMVRRGADIFNPPCSPDNQLEKVFKKEEEKKTEMFSLKRKILKEKNKIAKLSMKSAMAKLKAEEEEIEAMAKALLIKASQAGIPFPRHLALIFPEEGSTAEKPSENTDKSDEKRATGQSDAQSSPPWQRNETASISEQQIQSSKVNEPQHLRDNQSESQNPTSENPEEGNQTAFMSEQILISIFEQIKSIQSVKQSTK